MFRPHTPVERPHGARVAHGVNIDAQSDRVLVANELRTDPTSTACNTETNECRALWDLTGAGDYPM